MAFVRILVALLVLLQPLPALGLPGALPCPQRCSHCSASRSAESDCGCSAKGVKPDAPCSCAHETPQPEPYAPSFGPSLSGLDLLHVAASAPAPQPATWISSGSCSPASGLGHDPPPRLELLCVWRN